MLGHAVLSHGDQGELPRMGISERSLVLVHQRNGMSGRGSQELEQQDEDMPKL